MTTTTCRTSEMRFSFSRRRSDNRKTLGHSGKDGSGGRLGRTARECDARGCPGDDARRDARRPRTRMRPRSEPTRRTTTPRRRRRNDRRDRRMTCVRRRGDRRTDGSRVSFSRAFFDVCLFATMTMWVADFQRRARRRRRTDSPIEDAVGNWVNIFSLHSCDSRLTTPDRRRSARSRRYPRSSRRLFCYSQTR